MENLITLITFELPQESFIIKSKLESEDIYVFLKDEFTVQTDNFLSNAIGGVKLQVFEKDVEKSLEIIKLYDVKVYQNNEPEGFAVLFEKFTNKIPLLREVPFSFRGVFIILFIITTVLLLGFIVNLS